MFLAFVLAVVLAVVLFKLGVYSVLLALLELLATALAAPERGGRLRIPDAVDGPRVHERISADRTAVQSWR